MYNSLWQTILGEIELSLNDDVAFNTWFKDTSLNITTEDIAIIEVKNVFAVSQLQKKYDALIRSLFTKNGVTPLDVRYAPQKTGVKKTINREISTALPVTPAGDSTLPAMATVPISGNLNTKYTFDNFIVGGSNDLAYSAARAIADSPGRKWNPFFIYGGVGLGKTHLAQAIGNEIIDKNPLARVTYASLNDFTREFLDSIRFKKKFPDRYRQSDVLIIDDIQFLTGKEKTQDAFFDIFNTLHEANKQIILTSDRPPSSIVTLTDRLRSRFEMGMLVDVQLPDFETRCAIIETKAAMSGHELDRETVEYIAQSIKTNIRELEGSLNQLLAFSEMRGVTPDKNMAEGLITGASRTSRTKSISSRQVIDKTAKYFSLSPSEVCSAKRDKHIANARQVAMYLLRSELHLSYPQIASELGRKDHTTAMHSVSKIENSIKLDMHVREQVDSIREALYV